MVVYLPELRQTLWYFIPSSWGRPFACRHCHDLTYASCQQERKAGTLEKLIPGLAALDALLKFEKNWQGDKSLALC